MDKPALEISNFEIVICQQFERGGRIWLEGDIVFVTEELGKELILEGKAKKLEVNWEEYKRRIREKYSMGQSIIFPKFNNFESDVKISTSLQQKLPVYLVIPWENKKQEEKGIRFFDEFPVPKVRYDYENAIIKSYYEYTAQINNENYYLLSEEEITESLVRIKGLKTKLADVKKYGERCSLPTMKHIIIVNSFDKPKIRTEELKKACLEMDTFEKFTKNYFGTLRHPLWFEQLIIAWNIHNKHRYPMHLLINDVENDDAMQGGYGKSELLDRINRVNKNQQEIFDFSGMGTTKGLTMSFKSDKLQPGYLLNCENVACIDEFWAAITEMDRDDKVREFFLSLTSLFEHRNRTTQSGNTAPTQINPTFRCIAVGNLPKGWFDFSDVCQKVPTPFLQRVISYCYDKEHRTFIEENRDRVDDELDENKGEHVELDISEFLRLAKEIRVDFDETTLEGIKKMHNNIFSENVKDSMQSLIKNKKLRLLLKKRFNHHIKCLFDGIVKINHWKEFCDFLVDFSSGKAADNVFKPKITPEDYELCYSILVKIVSSWEISSN